MLTTAASPAFRRAENAARLMLKVPSVSISITAVTAVFKPCNLQHDCVGAYSPESQSRGVYMMGMKHLKVAVRP